MGQIAATIIDAADIISFDCLLPDGIGVSELASRLAEHIGYPSVGADNTPLKYGLVVKRGKALDSHKTLRELHFKEPLEIRLVPEVIAGQDDSAITEDKSVPMDIEIIGENALVESADTNLRMDVRIDAKIHKEIEEHTSRDRYTEYAGLLLGNVDIEDGMRVVHITAVIPATKAESTRNNVKITVGAWESMLRVRDEKYPDLRILGWLHTHTGRGVFLSEADVFIHRNFFSHPDMVAYVLDLVNGRDGFFCWQGETIVLAPSFGLVVTQDENEVKNEAKRNSRWPLIRNCVIALFVIGAACFGFTKFLMPHLAHKESPQHTTVTVTPVASNTITQDRIYVIGKRENLWKVCHKVYKDGELAEELAEYNGLSDYAGLQIGQKIKLPPQEVLEKLSED